MSPPLLLLLLMLFIHSRPSVRAFPFLSLCEIFLFVYFFFFQSAFVRFFFSFKWLFDTLNPHPNLTNLLSPSLTSHPIHASIVVLKTFETRSILEFFLPSKELKKNVQVRRFHSLAPLLTHNAHERVKKYVRAKSIDFDLVCFLFFGFNYQKVREKNDCFEKLYLYAFSLFSRKRERSSVLLRSFVALGSFFLLVSIGKSRSIGVVWWS